jgi:alpha-galactosidase/6-phospho-beta-glucosidase family protein
MRKDKNFERVFGTIANGIIIGVFVSDIINTGTELVPKMVDKIKAKKVEKKQRAEENKIEEVTTKYFERVYMHDDNGITHYYYKRKETEPSETTADTEEAVCREYKL